MIEQVDNNLAAWVRDVLKGVTVSLAAPDDSHEGIGISLYLLEFAQSPVLRGGPKRLPLQFSLRYLVTSWAEETADAHRAIGQLIFAAMEHPEYQIDFEPAPVALWSAFGISPRPSVILTAPVRLERPEPVVPVVRVPPIVKGAPVVSFFGRVLGPDDIPLANIAVEFPPLQLSTRTDNKGYFKFSGIPGGSDAVQLRLKGKGKVLDIEVKPASSAENPAVINWDVLAK
jgi:hypothetical protein